MIWKPVKGFEGKYEVSNTGRVRSCTRTILKGCRPSAIIKGKELKVTRARRYFKVGLRDGCRQRSFSIHRLVAEAFVPRPSIKLQVNHKDGNSWNNAASNLEWTTQSKNQLHAYKLGLQAAGAEHGKAHVVKQYTKDLRLLHTYSTLYSAAKAVGTNRANITRCCQVNLTARRPRSTAKKFIWLYGEDKKNEQYCLGRE